MIILFSRARMMTVTLKLEQGFLPQDYTKSLRDVGKPMNVVFINSERDVKKMKDLSKQLSVYGKINLVLFVKEFKSPLIGTCMNPVGNPFRLSEGFSIFVKCYEDIAIREWYAFYENQLEIYERNTWEPAKGLVLKSKKLKQTDNDILNGKVLRIGRFSISEKYDKYVDELFLALKIAGHFSTKNVYIKENFGIGSWNKTNKTWSGAMGLMQNNQLDILAYGTPLSQTVLDSFELTSPLYRFDLCLYIRKPSSKVEVMWSAYFTPLTHKTWCAWIVSLIVTVTLLRFLRLKVENGLYNGGISENFLHVWGCYFNQGLPEFPKALALRLFYYSTFLFGFFMFAVYSASYVSDLTVLQNNLPFKSLEEFVKDKSYKLAAHNPFFYDEQLKICSKKIVLLSIEFITSELSADTKIPCKLVKIKLERPRYFRMAMPKNSPYKKAINYYIIRLRTNGILKYIESELQDNSVSGISSINAPNEQIYEPETILDIASLLVMLFGSLVLSILILFFEKFYFTVRERKSAEISTRSRSGATQFRKLN
ncbi:uncharacterized protein LOC117178842 [Belonocnema kinseyi]|uniref:uncharacterized protein LOC117178842 n=1 Tax=Belonocnema kinseyi TaxID=2817044 RepID=UPI00143CF96B|nr:uncharacterized protein LOC117178842 [Belonocnema kinseyi]